MDAIREADYISEIRDPCTQGFRGTGRLRRNHIIYNVFSTFADSDIVDEDMKRGGEEGRKRGREDSRKRGGEEKRKSGRGAAGWSAAMYIRPRPPSKEGREGC